MSRGMTVVSGMLALALLLAASYGVRYALMEDAQWVGLCAAADGPWQCAVRGGLGLMIHFQVLAWSALACAVVAQLLAGRSGRLLALLAVLLGVPALVLYTASLAVFAVVLAGLRLVRRQA
ncbi:hypothetical protein SJI00_00990 [Pseudomonas sp. RP23018S]|uniref:hypothetical protein n=1 Tax=Pseudomonas sp. RP23018S TaxID=3096037 RepID=UPI002ACAB1CE|nr:hypothetical protein [Pseudomonas sp. RP23018S]MDZ5601360.1 hypothetical protein [Pseudomonas sp. RP23018S]